MDKRSQWERVDRDEVWKLPEGEAQVMPWLLLSFNHLPSATIKQCFAHCSSVFWKGMPYGEDYLISIWIAQGFIQPSGSTDDDSTMVDTGRKYINSMLANNLLQSTGEYYSMHDLMHGLALYVSMGSRLIIEDSNDLPEASTGVEHALILIEDGNISTSLLKSVNKQGVLRTLVCTCPGTISIDFVAQAIFLRQLNLMACGLKKIPSSIGGLKHLRILDLFDNPLEYLPGTIGRLYNLHVLNLQKCPRLVELPQQVTKLVNLRRIGTTDAVHIPKGMGQLTRLTHLPVVKLMARDGFKITELGSLQHLEGTIKIQQLQNISSKEEAMGAGLKNKEGITCLDLVWASTEAHEDDRVCCSDKSVMEGLQPHSNLEQLSVRDFHGKRFSSWLSDGLYCNNLTLLQLVDCKRCEQLPTLGCLPCLKSLIIAGMESVEVIGRDFFACTNFGSSHKDMGQSIFFPVLESCKLWNMLKLKEWVDPSGSCASAFPCLKELFVDNCPSLVSFPTCFHSLKKLETLQVWRCDSLTLLPDIEGLLSLRTLHITCCYNITDTPRGLEGCVSIEDLKLTICHKLNLIPDLASLSRLRQLKVVSFPEQLSIPRWTNQLSSLTRMHVGLFDTELNNFYGIDHLPKYLKDLTLYGWPKLKYLPNELQYLTQLEKLGIWLFEGVEALPEWLGSLSSLQVLDIRGCQNMKLLLSSDAMRRLTRLRVLKICDCPELEERCRKEGGEEWHKISHLPTILFNDQVDAAEEAEQLN